MASSGGAHQLQARTQRESALGGQPFGKVRDAFAPALRLRQAKRAARLVRVGDVPALVALPPILERQLDIATDDRPAEVGRLQELGAEPVGEGPMWTVLRPPAGPALCVTSRDPVTGVVT